jgi:hypothetical protein
MDLADLAVLLVLQVQVVVADQLGLLEVVEYLEQMDLAALLELVVHLVVQELQVQDSIPLIILELIE